MAVVASTKASWKANGMVCVDGVLYLSVSQHRHWRADCIQKTYDASIVKSEDYGKTWTAEPAVGDAMFADNFFSTPWFVKYGKDHNDSPDDYVYAVSHDGAWNNGSFLMIGRIHKSKIADLNPDNWQIFAGPDKDSGELRWNNHLVKVTKKPKPGDDIGDIPDALSTPVPIFEDRYHVGMTGIQYVPALDRYILGQWFFPDLDNEGFGRTGLILLEAPNMEAMELVPHGREVEQRLLVSGVPGEVVRGRWTQNVGHGFGCVLRQPTARLHVNRTTA